jgi:hypothetical protein
MEKFLEKKDAMDKALDKTREEVENLKNILS